MNLEPRRAVRIVSQCSSWEDFVAVFQPYLDGASLFIATATPEDDGVEVAFTMTLASGRTVLRGAARVVESHHDRKNFYGLRGMKLRFDELDEPSRRTLVALEASERVLVLRGGRATAEVIECLIYEEAPQPVSPPPPAEEPALPVAALSTDASEQVTSRPPALPPRTSRTPAWSERDVPDVGVSLADDDSDEATAIVARPERPERPDRRPVEPRQSPAQAAPQRAGRAPGDLAAARPAADAGTAPPRPPISMKPSGSDLAAVPPSGSPIETAASVEEVTPAGLEAEARASVVTAELVAIDGAAATPEGAAPPAETTIPSAEMPGGAPSRVLAANDSSARPQVDRAPPGKIDQPGSVRLDVDARFADLLPTRVGPAPVPTQRAPAAAATPTIPPTSVPAEASSAAALAPGGRGRRESLIPNVRVPTPRPAIAAAADSAVRSLVPPPPTDFMVAPSPSRPKPELAPILTVITHVPSLRPTRDDDDDHDHSPATAAALAATPDDRDDASLPEGGGTMTATLDMSADNESTDMRTIGGLSGERATASSTTDRLFSVQLDPEDATPRAQEHVAAPALTAAELVQEVEPRIISSAHLSGAHGVIVGQPSHTTPWLGPDARLRASVSPVQVAPVPQPVMSRHVTPHPMVGSAPTMPGGFAGRQPGPPAGYGRPKASEHTEIVRLVQQGGTRASLIVATIVAALLGLGVGYLLWGLDTGGGASAPTVVTPR